VAKVEALVDDMDERGRPGIGDSPMDAQARRQIREDARRLRTALASVGVSGSADDRREANASQAPDTATPGEAVRHNHITRDIRPFTCPACDPASSADDNLGGES
jgi:hypothetical protein